MHWFFVIVTWMGSAGLMSQEIPAYPNTETECRAVQAHRVAVWEGSELPDGFGFGYVIGECQYGEGVEKVK